MWCYCAVNTLTKYWSIFTTFCALLTTVLKFKNIHESIIWMILNCNFENFKVPWQLDHGSSCMTHGSICHIFSNLTLVKKMISFNFETRLPEFLWSDLSLTVSWLLESLIYPSPSLSTPLSSSSPSASYEDWPLVTGFTSSNAPESPLTVNNQAVEVKETLRWTGRGRKPTCRVKFYHNLAQFMHAFISINHHNTYVLLLYEP